ncbi:hypothetical protein [Algoriphagus sp.]
MSLWRKVKWQRFMEVQDGCVFAVLEVAMLEEVRILRAMVRQQVGLH